MGELFEKVVTEEGRTVNVRWSSKNFVRRLIGGGLFIVAGYDVASAILNQNWWIGLPISFYVVSGLYLIVES